MSDNASFKIRHEKQTEIAYQYLQWESTSSKSWVKLDNPSYCIIYV